MKTLPLLACLAVPVAAVAAELKDPTVVARDWNQAIEQAREPSIPPQDLRTQSDALTTTPLERIFSTDQQRPAKMPKHRWKFDDGPRRKDSPEGRLYDAPNYRVPDVLPDNLPPGAKPWEFEGRIYWLIPINPYTGR